LPPDNFQEDPHPVVAHRTSPTNVGLYLLSTVAARDFGWIGTLDTVERLEATFSAMAGLERYGSAAQPLAALPDARLSRLGALGVLSGAGRLRVSRSAPTSSSRTPRA
jgi:hypothetical protein